MPGQAGREGGGIRLNTVAILAQDVCSFPLYFAAMTSSGQVKSEQRPPPNKKQCLNKTLFDINQVKPEPCSTSQVNHSQVTSEETPKARKPMESPASDQATVGSSSTTFKKRLTSSNFIHLSPSPVKPHRRPPTPRSGNKRKAERKSATPNRSHSAQPSPVASGSMADTAQPRDDDVEADTGGTPESRPRRARAWPASASAATDRKERRRIHAAFQQQKRYLDKDEDLNKWWTNCTLPANNEEVLHFKSIIVACKGGNFTTPDIHAFKKNI